MSDNSRAIKAFGNVGAGLIEDMGIELFEAKLVELIDSFSEETIQVILSYPDTREMYEQYKERERLGLTGAEESDDV